MCGLRTLATLPGKVRYLIESRTEAVIHFEPDGRRPACLNADAVCRIYFLRTRRLFFQSAITTSIWLLWGFSGSSVTARHSAVVDQLCASSLNNAAAWTA